MPTDTGNSPNSDEINRLVDLGLSVQTAMAVAGGKMDEAFEVAHAEEKLKVDLWCKGRKNIPHALTARWDLTQTNFYLTFDGENPTDHSPADFVLIEANVDDVNCVLTHAASRDKDPWHQKYKRKSCGIAYRWLNGLVVTPPLLGVYGDRLHICGGMHRFHLAKHYGTKRMPFLVRKPELENVNRLIPVSTVTT